MTKTKGTNVCAGKKPIAGFENTECTTEAGVVQVLEQAGADVTAGYEGQFNASGRKPITEPYWKVGLCPVNVHWHLGTEHRSKGQYDEDGHGPAHTLRRLSQSEHHSGPERLLASDARLGFRCHHYKKDHAHYTKEYHWQHCKNMKVGETYEVHWPHSQAGACGTPNQYQTPFYDGVFCVDGVITSTHTQIGVQAQIFTIVNDEEFYYPDLIKGMIVDGEMGKDVAKYTGSTTGTTRNNKICSKYTPITWQVDRTCHKISASSFDKMCADMKLMRDDMSGDLEAHGARELVNDTLAANNLHRL